MILKGLHVENFRSITTAQDLSLASGLTVIVGPNNEGKSNLLRSIVLALDFLRQVPRWLNPRLSEGYLSHSYSRTYSWETDFPQNLQKKLEGETVVKLTFQLDSDETKQLRKIVSWATGALTLDVRFGDSRGRYRFANGSRGFGKNSSKVAKLLLDAFDFVHIPAIRPSDLSIDVIGTLIDRELDLLSEKREYREALETIERIQRPVMSRIERNVQANLRQLLPSVKKIKISTAHTRSGPRLRKPTFLVNDGVETSLEMKGDGIKSLAAISLMKSASEARGGQGLTVAIEEPESHLHPDAVRKLSRVLREIAEERQVIISTHSPLLIARGNVASNIIVNKSKARAAKDIAEIRSALGVSVQDNLVNCESVILVEGQHDISALSVLFTEHSTILREQIRECTLGFDHMGGATNWPYKIATLQELAVRPFVILDGDKEGLKAYGHLEKSTLISDKHIFCWHRKGEPNSEFEDIIDEDAYWQELEDEYGIEFSKEAFRTNRLKWAERMKLTFEESGKRWTDSTESNVKNIVAKCVRMRPNSAIAAGSRPLFKRIVNSVESALTLTRRYRQLTVIRVMPIEHTLDRNVPQHYRS